MYPDLALKPLEVPEPPSVEVGERTRSMSAIQTFFFNFECDIDISLSLKKMYDNDAPPAKPSPPAIVEAKERIHGDVDTAPNKKDINSLINIRFVTNPNDGPGLFQENCGNQGEQPIHV